MDKLTKQLLIKADVLLMEMDFPSSGRIDRRMINAELNRKIRMDKQMNSMILNELIRIGRIKKKRNYMVIEK